MRRIDQSHVYSHPAQVLDQAVRAVLPQCGAKIDGHRTEGDVAVTTAHASVHLGAGGQYVTCRVEPLPNDTCRLHIESTYWQVDAKDAAHVVDRIFSEAEQWLKKQAEEVPEGERVAGPRRCAECGVILSPTWKFCPMCSAAVE
jgi:phosphatidylserine/phosphatidylglycerophosphate/cardiolipin synthase-like enzyme